MSSMFASALEGYFEVFFKNFKREDFKLNLSGSETTTSMHNLGMLLLAVFNIFLCVCASVMEGRGQLRLRCHQRPSVCSSVADTLMLFLCNHHYQWHHYYCSPTLFSLRTNDIRACVRVV
jgi:hypothetical protein